MLTLFILIVLGFGFLMGLRRGLILQIFHLTGFIISFIIATIFFRDLAEKLSFYIPYLNLGDDEAWAVFLANMPLEEAFYNAVSFALIFFVSKIILQIIATMFDFVARLPLLKWINALFGAILGFLEVYLITFVLLFIAALIPLEKIQTILKGSSLATWIITKTPILSNQLESLWFTEWLTKF